MLNIFLDLLYINVPFFAPIYQVKLQMYLISKSIATVGHSSLKPFYIMNIIWNINTFDTKFCIQLDKKLIY